MLVRAIDPKANVRAVEPDTSNRDYDDRRAAAEEFLEVAVGGPGADLGRRMSECLEFVAPGKSEEICRVGVATSAYRNEGKKRVEGQIISPEAVNDM